MPQKAEDVVLLMLAAAVPAHAKPLAGSALAHPGNVESHLEHSRCAEAIVIDEEWRLETPSCTPCQTTKLLSRVALLDLICWILHCAALLYISLRVYEPKSVPAELLSTT